ncbi:Scd6-like Sm domain-containing protein [Mycena epipterygia]|nr:Scd6-like Sm domain-containing protein [Mycena epipterygia]
MANETDDEWISKSSRTKTRRPPSLSRTTGKLLPAHFAKKSWLTQNERSTPSATAYIEEIGSSFIFQLSHPTGAAAAQDSEPESDAAAATLKPASQTGTRTLTGKYTYCTQRRTPQDALPARPFGGRGRRARDEATGEAAMALTGTRGVSGVGPAESDDLQALSMLGRPIPASGDALSVLDPLLTDGGRKELSHMLYLRRKAEIEILDTSSESCLVDYFVAKMGVPLATVWLSISSDVRYRGILAGIDPAASTIRLTNACSPKTVLSMGTESRRSAEYIPPVQEPYQYIVFRVSEVKNLSVDEASAPRRSVYDDPAVLGAPAPVTPSAPPSYAQKTAAQLSPRPQPQAAQQQQQQSDNEDEPAPPKASSSCVSAHLRSPASATNISHSSSSPLPATAMAPTSRSGTRSKSKSRASAPASGSGCTPSPSALSSASSDVERVAPPREAYRATLGAFVPEGGEPARGQVQGQVTRGPGKGGGAHTQFSRLTKKTRANMHQLLRTATEDEMKGMGSMKWDVFVKACISSQYSSVISDNGSTQLMREMGFEYDPSTATSSVRFDPPDPRDVRPLQSITFHKPHPDPTIHPVILREFAKKLKKTYGWSEADFLSARASN